MKNLSEFQNHSIRFLFTDIDDTLTDDGKLKSAAYQSLWKLKDRGFFVVPITGRPAGWCEMIARFWPVDGVIGENGAFYFRHQQKTMKRHFVLDPTQRLEFRKKLDQVIAPEVLHQVKGSAIASDQFARLTDLAIDYCEDVAPLAPHDVRKIVEIFEKHGAHAKVSSIHVNGWYGDFDKLSTCKIFLKQEFGLDAETSKDKIAFVGDSPNDEPMFGFFENSFAVANITSFLSQLQSQPSFVAHSRGGEGFCEVVEALLKN